MADNDVDVSVTGNAKCNGLSAKVGVPAVLHPSAHDGAMMLLHLSIVATLNIAFNVDEELQVDPWIDSADSSRTIQILSINGNIQCSEFLCMVLHMHRSNICFWSLLSGLSLVVAQGLNSFVLGVLIQLIHPL